MNRKYRSGLLAAVLLFIALCAAPSLKGGYSWRDAELFGPGGALGRASLSTLFEKGGPDAAWLAGTYRPVAWTLLKEFPAAGARARRAAGLLLHLAAALLLYFVARRLTGSGGGGLAAALLFGVHPVVAPAVASPSLEPIVIAAVFLLAAWALALRGADSPRGMLLAPLSALLFALALLSHEQAAAWTLALPAGFLGAVAVRGETPPPVFETRRLAALLLPPAALLLGYVILRSVLGAWPAWSEVFPADAPAPGTSLTALFDHTARALGRLCLPVGGLAFVTPPEARTLYALLGAGAFVLFAALFVLVPRRGLRAGLALLAAGLLLEPGLLVPGPDPYLPGRLYLAAAGLALVGADLLAPLLASSQESAPFRTTAAALCLAALVLGYGTARTSLAWGSDVALAKRSLRNHQNDLALREKYGVFLYLAGKYPQADSQLRYVGEQGRSTVTAHNTRGLALKAMKVCGLALEEFLAAVTLEPGFAEGYVNLGNCYLDLGNPREAKISYAQALYLAPELPAAHLGMSLADFAQGNYPEAVRSCRQAQALGARVDPQYLQMLAAAAQRPAQRPPHGTLLLDRLLQGLQKAIPH